MRVGRLIIGTVAVGAAIWVLVGEQMAGASADAVVNARLSTLRAPIAGLIGLQERAFGATVQHGEVLGTIIDPLVDNVRLNDLRMERAFAQAALTRVEMQIAATEAEVAALEERSARYRTQRLAEITDRLEHARERLRILETFDLAGAGRDGLEAELAKML